MEKRAIQRQSHARPAPSPSAALASPPAPLRIGTAGWSFPTRLNHLFPLHGTKLERYAARYSCVEINSTFYRPHRLATLQRWAASVPDHFRFSIKLTREITHVKRLVNVEADLDAFLPMAAALGEKLGPVLVQLPPKLEFAGDVSASFLRALGARRAFTFVLEPRHATWFTSDVDALLCAEGIGRVAADPPRHPADGKPAGDPRIAYFRLHGAPRIYYSQYPVSELRLWDARIAHAYDTGAEVWCIFDNTALGEAWTDALALESLWEGRNAAA